MLFDEAALNLNLGCKILSGRLVVGRFGQNQVKSLVAISQTLDKLVVHDPSFIVQGSSQSVPLIGGGGGGDDDEDDNGGGGPTNKQQIKSTTADGNPKPVYYIAIKDVIRTISVVTFMGEKDLMTAPATDRGSNLIVGAANNQQPTASNIDDDGSQMKMMMAEAKTQHRQSRDLLLIGCSNSVLIYDASSQSNLFSINTPTPISALSVGEPMVESAEATTCFNSPFQAGGRSSSGNGTSRPIICGGSQKIYALRFDGCPTFMMDGFNHVFSNTTTYNNNNNFNVEISSERSTGDTINCLAQGRLKGLDLVLTGSLEHRIRIYLLDSFEQNIQPCKLSIEELATINCLCPVNTGSGDDTSGDIRRPLVAAATFNRESLEQLLPSVIQQNLSQNQLTSKTTTTTTDLLQFKTTNATNEQMNYFAYGLENGIIGVYRLLLNDNNNDDDVDDTLARNTSLFHERLWRYKCKHTPLSMLLYDIDGDGLDELVVGFRGGRLEVRSPFTGQLMAATRCFKSDRLAALTVMDYHNDGRPMLLACSISGSLVGYRPKFSRPRRILQGYNLPAATRRTQPDSTSAIDFSFASLDEILTYGNGTTSLASDSLNFWSAGNHTDTGGGVNLKTIEEEQQQQQQDVFMTLKGGKSVGEADLHIETLNDDTKPSECDSRQSCELLLKLSALRSEQMELERTACNIYHRSLQQATEFYPTDITIGHRWDFDQNKAYLRLTIVISSSVEEIKLIEFEDESGNVLSKGHLLMQPASKTADRPTTSGGSKRSHVFVVPVRTKRDVESRLNLRIHCECLQRFSTSKASSGGGGDDDKVGGEVLLARVYGKSIHVPKFSMITLAPLPPPPPSSANGFERNKMEPDTTGNRKIRIVFRLSDGSKLVQILDWLNESFLCFKFGQLIENTDGNNNNSIHWIQQQTPNSSLIAPAERPTSSHPTPATGSSVQRRYSLMVDDAESFELNLLDLRHSLLKRISVDGNRRNPRTLDSSNLAEADDEETDKASQTKFLELASHLTIGYSNGLLRFESVNSDLLVALIQSLVIDRLQLRPSGSSVSTFTAATTFKSKDDGDDDDYEQEHELSVVDADVGPILSELDELTNSSRQLEESESRIQTELYESADYTNSLMQQLANANELNEFTIAKELLNELFMMLNQTQNSARAQCLNNRSRLELLKQINGLRDKLTFLSTHYS